MTSRCVYCKDPIDEAAFKIIREWERYEYSTAPTHCSLCLKETAAMMTTFSTAERKYLTSNFCKECMRPDPKCQCWNDE